MKNPIIAIEFTALWQESFFLRSAARLALSPPVILQISMPKRTRQTTEMAGYEAEDEKVKITYLSVRSQWFFRPCGRGSSFFEVVLEHMVLCERGKFNSYELLQASGLCQETHIERRRIRLFHHTRYRRRRRSNQAVATSDLLSEL